MTMINTDLPNEFRILRDKGAPVLLTGQTGGGKSTLMSIMALDPTVEDLLLTRESEGKGSTVPTTVIVTDDPKLPEDRLLAGGVLQPISQADCEDDMQFAAPILYYGIKQYAQTKNEDDYERKLKEQLNKALESAKIKAENNSLVYRLRDLSENRERYDALLAAFHAFPPEKLLSRLQEAEVLCPKDPKKQAQRLMALIRSDPDFQKPIQDFWDCVTGALNDGLGQLEELLRQAGAVIEEKEDGKRFFVALDDKDVGSPLVSALLKSEDDAKEYLLRDFTLMFRGRPELFRDSSRQLVVLERDGVPVRCWRFIDTQGLFHAQAADASEEADRIRDMISRFHSDQLVVVLDARTNNTTKDSDMALCQMLSEIRAQISVFFIYTHWDSYIKGFNGASAPSVRRGQRVKVDWSKVLEEARRSLDQRHEAFQKSLALNSNKKCPTLCGKVDSAILGDEGSGAEDILYSNGITGEEALPKLLGLILDQQVKTGAKYRVVEGMENHFKLNTNSLISISIKSLYQNLTSCKEGRLYASTVRAALRKWCRAGASHKAEVAANTHGFVAIETRFVDEIRNYTQNFIQDLEFKLEPCLCDPDRKDQATEDLRRAIQQDLGREVAKEIGERAYRGGFLADVPGTPFPYQYERLHQMLDYAQKNYFSFTDIFLTQEFREVLDRCVRICIKRFVDERCVLVCGEA